MTKFSNKLKWITPILIIVLTLNCSFIVKNNKLKKLQMININPEKFKEVKIENGVIAVITIKSLETLLKGTRSKKVVYKVQVENKIIGDMNEFDSIWNYGNPILEEGKKYLVFLSRGKRLMGTNDFQRLNCNKCNDIIIACKKELSKY